MKTKDSPIRHNGNGLITRLYCAECLSYFGKLRLLLSEPFISLGGIGRFYVRFPGRGIDFKPERKIYEEEQQYPAGLYAN